MNKSVLMVSGVLLSSLLGQAAFASCPSSSISLSSGDTGSYYFGQGQGCIQKSLMQIWGELQTQNGMAFSGSNLDSSNQVSPAQGALVTYENQYSAGGMFSVSWTMDWSSLLKGGSAQNPTALEVHYQKVDGTSFIGYWEGNIDLQADGPQSTKVVIRNQIHATDTSQSDAADTVQQIFDKLK